MNNTAATCEQTSPSTAMHVQRAQIISPLCLIATHTFNGVADKLCECFTIAVKRYTLGQQLGATVTLMFFTQP